jgi:general stress protein YciG
MAEKEKIGDMSVKDAGHKGGEKTAETHGREFYEEIGHKGGEKTAETHGKEFYEEIGHKGGEKGGQRVKELIEKGKETKR